MADNPCKNLKSALAGKPIQSIYGWTDSFVPLHWLRGKGNYKQLVSNRVNEIQKKSYIYNTWEHLEDLELLEHFRKQRKNEKKRNILKC